MLFSTHSSWKKQKKKRNERSHQISINIIRLRQEKWPKVKMYLLLQNMKDLIFVRVFRWQVILQCIRRLLFTVIGHTEWWYNALCARAAVLFLPARLCRTSDVVQKVLQQVIEDWGASCLPPVAHDNITIRHYSCQRNFAKVFKKLPVPV